MSQTDSESSQTQSQGENPDEVVRRRYGDKEVLDSWGVLMYKATHAENRCQLKKKIQQQTENMGRSNVLYSNPLLFRGYVQRVPA